MSERMRKGDGERERRREGGRNRGKLVNLPT